MNKEIAKMAESLDPVHTYTQPLFTKTVFTKKTQYEVETCRKIQVKFNMRKRS